MSELTERLMKAATNALCYPRVVIRVEPLGLSLSMWEIVGGEDFRLNYYLPWADIEGAKYDVLRDTMTKMRDDFAGAVRAPR